MTVEVIDNDAEMALTPVTQARQMLAEAQTMPELRNLRDYATAAQAWAKARGMGIEAENEAAEVILRAERRIGQQLVALKEDGYLTQGRMTRLPDDEVTPQAVRFRRKRDEAGLRPLEELVSLKDLGVSNQESSHFQRLANLPDDLFERMLYSAKAGGERLAKHNFYRAARPAKGSAENPSVPTREDPDFGTFRRGTYALLGWEIDETGKGHATRNGLAQLPNDELAQAARLIQALAAAYGEARSARG